MSTRSKFLILFMLSGFMYFGFLIGNNFTALKNYEQCGYTTCGWAHK